MLPNKPDPYLFSFANGETNAYTFTTEAGAAYLIRFKITPYLFVDKPQLSEHIYELVIDLVRSPVSRMALDPRIGPTVVAICGDFLQQQKNVVIYVCETADLRHIARVRKFDNWFRQAGVLPYLKIDSQLPDPDGFSYYISLIIHKSNPDFNAITSAFKQLLTDYDTGK